MWFIGVDVEQETSAPPPNILIYFMKEALKQ